MKKVYIETYGCQMNVADTEVVFSILTREGYDRTEDIAEAVPARCSSFSTILRALSTIL